jgi:hypothetical protein
VSGVFAFTASGTVKLFTTIGSRTAMTPVAARVQPAVWMTHDSVAVALSPSCTLTWFVPMPAAIAAPFAVHAYAAPSTGGTYAVATPFRQANSGTLIVGTPQMSVVAGCCHSCSSSSTNVCSATTGTSASAD